MAIIRTVFGRFGAVVGSILNNAATYGQQSSVAVTGAALEFWIGSWMLVTGSSSAGALLWVDFSKNPNRVKTGLLTWNQVVIDAAAAESGTQIAIAPDGTLQGSVYVSNAFMTSKGLTLPPPPFALPNQKPYEFQLLIDHDSVTDTNTRYYGFQAEIVPGPATTVNIWNAGKSTSADTPQVINRLVNLGDPRFDPPTNGFTKVGAAGVLKGALFIERRYARDTLKLQLIKMPSSFGTADIP